MHERNHIYKHKNITFSRYKQTLFWLSLELVIEFKQSLPPTFMITFSQFCYHFRNLCGEGS